MLLKVLSLLWLTLGAPLAQDFSPMWFNHKEAPRLVRSAILVANYKVPVSLADELKAKALAKQIVKASRTFHLDPMIFTALVWRESHFITQAQSETGAVGLTQLTKPGVQEVIERLALRSPRLHTHLRAIMAASYPSILKSIPHDPKKANLAEWKSKIAKSPQLALVFGAVLFRINFKGDYRKALERYNGDPKIKARYAHEVMVLAGWIASSFKVIPLEETNNSKFLASIQGF